MEGKFTLFVKSQCQWPITFINAVAICLSIMPFLYHKQMFMFMFQTSTVALQSLSKIMLIANKHFFCMYLDTNNPKTKAFYSTKLHRVSVFWSQHQTKHIDTFCIVLLLFFFTDKSANMLCFSMEVIWRGGIKIKDIFKPKCKVCGLWLWTVHRTWHFQLLLKKTEGALYSFQASCNNQEWADLWEKGYICSCHLIPCMIRKGRICAKTNHINIFFMEKDQCRRTTTGFYATDCQTTQVPPSSGKAEWNNDKAWSVWLVLLCERNFVDIMPLLQSVQPSPARINVGQEHFCKTTNYWKLRFF